MMLFAQRMHAADIEFISLEGKLAPSPRVTQILLKTDADLAKFTAWAEREGVPFDEARVATADEIRAFDEVPW